MGLDRRCWLLPAARHNVGKLEEFHRMNFVQFAWTFAGLRPGVPGFG
jgi:hypothetical protein